MIIDFHTHVDHAEAYGWFDPPEKLLPLLDEAGIERAVIMTYVDLPGANPQALQLIADAVSRYPDRLTGFIRLDPKYRDAAREALDRAVLEAGFRGVKLHPTTTLAHPAGAPTIALLERAAELGVSVLFHCGDDPYTTPQAIELAAARVPECTVVMGHMGGYFHVDDAIAAAVRQPNLVLETSAMPYPWRIAEAVRAVGADRVVFGSDGPGCSPSLEVQKIRQLELDPIEERAVLVGTAARLLGLEIPPDAAEASA
jgi:predicted TIM-barrel fold metal-dependent hydrolase